MRVTFLFVLFFGILCSTMLQATSLEQNGLNLVTDNLKVSGALLLKKIHDHNMIFDDYSLGVTPYEEEGMRHGF